MPTREKRVIILDVLQSLLAIGLTGTYILLGISGDVYFHVRGVFLAMTCFSKYINCLIGSSYRACTGLLGLSGLTQPNIFTLALISPFSYSIL